jgi:hypothetical protein
MSYIAREGKNLLNPKETLSRCVQEMKPSPLTKLQAKMARCKMFGPREEAKRRQVSSCLHGTRPLL